MIKKDFIGVGTLIAIGAIVIVTGLLLWSGRTYSAPPSTPTDGSIQIPSDLHTTFDQLVKEMESAQLTINKNAPVVQQILRISMDRAGVKPEQFEQYEFDKPCSCIKKKVQGQGGK